MPQLDKIYIYAIYFPTSKRVCPYYIGQTAYLKRRMAAHLVSKHLVGNVLRKYDDWQIEILHTTKDRDEANRIEIEEIRHYDCVAPNGYNLTRGGDGGSLPGQKRSEKTKEKMSCAAKVRKTKPFSKEHKRKISERMKGNKYSLGHKHTKETKEKLKGNKNAQGNKANKDKIFTDSHRERISKNNSMKDPLNVKKMLFTRYKNELKRLEEGK